MIQLEHLVKQVRGIPYGGGSTTYHHTLAPVINAKKGLFHSPSTQFD